MGTKTTKVTRFYNRNENKGTFIPNSNHETRKTRIQQGFITKKKPNKAMTRKHTQIGVEHTKGNGKFYFYLYPLST
jgi:hypothetical protein